MVCNGTFDFSKQQRINLGSFVCLSNSYNYGMINLFLVARKETNNILGDLFHEYHPSDI